MVKRTACTLLLMVASWAGTAAAEPKRFDHFQEKHAEVACNDCHRRGEKQKWRHVTFPKKHKPCENSGCHAGKVLSFDPRKPGFCRTCHLPGRGGRGINSRRLVYPPYRKGEERQLALASSDHAKHQEAGKCSDCHERDEAHSGGPDVVLVGHEGCAACHGKETKPAMDQCGGCHVKKDQTVMFASSEWSNYRVANVFSHEKHEEKTGKNECTACHVNTKVKKGTQVPLPAMKDCLSCHDGDQAFDALGSQCRRCHESPQISPPMKASVELASFSHELHADQNVVGSGGAYACNDCHPSTERGRLWFPAGGRNFDPKVKRNGHWPCAKCHANEYMSREPKGVCVTCHTHSDPWRANPVRTAFRERRELVTDLPHDKHDKTACKKCHFEQTGDPPPAVPANLMAPGHELCAQCHETLEKAPMTKCDGCHRLPTPAEKPTEWSVAAKFTHETHRTDVRSKGTLACEVCHQSIDAQPTPEMKSCRVCHDGTHAFKDTGFACARCHGPKAVEETKVEEN